MKRKHVSYIFLAAAVTVLVVLLLLHKRITPISIIEKIERKETPKQEHGDTIKALIYYHAADYFVYQGSVIGFQYDLIRQLGKDLHRPVSISIEVDPDQALLKSFSNDYDIVGFDFNKELYVPLYLAESVPHSYTYPVLITRKKMAIDSNSVHIVHAPAKYARKIDFSILGHSGEWTLVHDKDLTVEDLFAMLEDTLVDYVVCNFNVAITMMPFYTGLHIGPRIGENFPRTWGLNPFHPELNEKINQWLVNFKKTKQYQKLCEKYLSAHSYVIKRSFGSRRENISSYDKCMKAACARYHIDWRFMSSIIFQESHFSSDVLGMGGSFGIMQMMPATCERYGITDSSSVEEQLWAGARYISHLYNIFANKTDTADIYHFVAASYNAGPGHILDAQALCRKYGGNATQWEEVAEYLALKSHKEYYSDPVVKCGYYPGKHTINYTNEVMNRYNGYLITKKEQ